MSFQGAQKRLTPTQLMNMLRESYQKKCSSLNWNTIKESQEEALVEYKIIDCKGPFGAGEQYEVVKIIKGTWAIHRVSYTTKKSPLTESEKKEWIERINGTKLVNIEKIRNRNSN